MITQKVFTNELENRIDPNYYHPRFVSFFSKLKQSKYDLVNLSEITKSVFQGVGKNETNDNDVTLLKVKNITQESGIDYEDVEYVKDVPESKLLETKDIISPFIGEATRLGKFALFNGSDAKYTVDNNTGVIRADKTKILPEYLLTVLSSEIGKVQIERLIGGGGVPFLGAGNAKLLQIPLPTIEQQREIALILQNALQSKEEKLKQADELLNSIDDFVRQHLGIDYKEPEEEKIYTVNSQGLENNRQDPYYYNPKFAKLLNSVGSNLKMASLSDIAEGVFNGNTPAKDNYTDEGKPIVKVSCLKKNKIEWSNLAYAKDKKLNKHLRDNDILLLSSAHQAEYLGKNPCLVEIPDNLKETDITFVGELICIRPNTKLVNSYYLLAILRLDEYHLLINREKRGQTSHIYPDDLEKIKVTLPDKRKQDAIAQEFKNRLNKTASLKNEASKQLEDAKKKVEEMILN